MVASDFDGLRGYRTLEYEGPVPTKPYNCCFSRVFHASVCIATYGMSVPSLHTESTDSVIITTSQTTTAKKTQFTLMICVRISSRVWLSVILMEVAIYVTEDAFL